MDFFGEITLAEALQQTTELVNSACSGQRPRRRSGQLLFFVQRLQELLDAALCIHQQQGWHSDAILKKPASSLPDIQQTNQYVHDQLGGNAWSCFPRHLSSKQYHNPYRVFKKIAHTASAAEWKKMLQDLLEFALINGAVTDVHPAATILRVQKRLCQLLEAGHLLAVRVPAHRVSAASQS